MTTKKHPKLPNGFGSIKKLSGNRTNKYGVYPPTTEFSANGSPITPKALCYVSAWYTGFYALMKYRDGTFLFRCRNKALRPSERGHTQDHSLL